MSTQSNAYLRFTNDEARYYSTLLQESPPCAYTEFNEEPPYYSAFQQVELPNELFFIDDEQLLS